jgi:2'-5' RNA ligase
MNLAAPTPAQARLFIGLWPDDRLRSALAAHQAAWRWPPGTARVAAEKLHLTLHFLGQVERARVGPLQRSLDAVAAEPFELAWSQCEVWPGGIAVLRLQDAPPLDALQRAIGEPLADQGFTLESRAYKPHLTLARKAKGAVAPAVVDLPAWRVREFVLVESRGAYHLLSRHGLSALA